MDPAELKRQIIMMSENSGIRKKMKGSNGLNNDEVVEMGLALEEMVKTRGWAFIEAYILKNANPIGLLFEDDDPVKKGEARAFIRIIQYVDQTIRAKNEIIRDGAETDDK